MRTSRRKYILPFILIMLLFGLNSSAIFTSEKGDIKTVFKDQIAKTNEYYNNLKSYSFDIEYKLYKNYSTNQVYDSMDGFFIKSGNSYHSSVLGIETIQNDKEKVIIDESSLSVVIANPDEIDASNLVNVNLDQILSKASLLKSWDYGILKAYKMNFGINWIGGYSSIEFYVNKYDQIEKLVLFFSTSQVFDDTNKSEKSEKPRVEIIYRNFKKNYRVGWSEFNTNLVIKKSNKSYSLVGEYTNYTLYNQKL